MGGWLLRLVYEGGSKFLDICLITLPGFILGSKERVLAEMEHKYKINILKRFQGNIAEACRFSKIDSIGSPLYPENKPNNDKFCIGRPGNWFNKTALWKKSSICNPKAKTGRHSTIPINAA